LLPSRPCAGDRLFENAAVAHAVGHLRYSKPGVPVEANVPLMVAVLSLLEDFRIERLMAQEFPGLRKVWGRFYPSTNELLEKGLTFETLVARLSFAVQDPNYVDPHHWVEKGRRLVDDICTDVSNDTRFREVATVLASDLGQMRVRIDPQSYRVWPDFRDDNTYLWNFEDREAVFALIEARGAQAQGVPEAAGDGEKHTEDEGAFYEAKRIERTYPEWNYATEVLRKDWVRVLEGPPLMTSNETAVPISIGKRTASSTVHYHRELHFRRLRRQAEGDDIDLDALVNHVVARKSQQESDNRVFTRPGRRVRDASVLLLLDLSKSTSRKLAHTGSTLLDVERQASMVAIDALDSAHVRIGLHGFASNGRSEVRYVRFKDFGQQFDASQRNHLWMIEPAWSTRMGAALRHAGDHIEREVIRTKTIILVTDGEPSDIDVFDRRYLIEDARHAVDELAARGVKIQCLNVDPRAHAEVRQIFGWRHCLTLERGERITDALPNLLSRSVE
jgi:nitric oxide reductase NorD protein